MRSDVDHFKQPEDCKQSISKYEKKIPWAVYQVEKDERHQIKAQLHEHVKQDKEIGKDATAPLTQQIEQLKKKCGNFAKAAEAVNAANGVIRDLQHHMFQNENKLQNAKGKLTAIDDEELKRRMAERSQIEEKIGQMRDKMEPCCNSVSHAVFAEASKPITYSRCRWAENSRRLLRS
jgi:hypothetical protein